MSNRNNWRAKEHAMDGGYKCRTKTAKEDSKFADMLLQLAGKEATR